MTNTEAVRAQACDPTTPSFTAVLTGKPDSVWISPNGPRKGNCCGTSNPDRCVEFWVTLDPNAQGIKFDIASGAIPSGAMYYQVSCGPPVAVGSQLCLNTPGPHRITFCKPGNNDNTYRIQSIAKPGVSAPTVVSDGCTSIIRSTGYQPATITWKSIAPGAVGAYNSYLNCTSGCASVTATYTPTAPPFVDYQVCGTPIGGCSGASVCNTVRVFFVSTLDVTIAPTNPTICFGGAATTLTANPTGGSGSYRYQWSSGQTTQSISVNTAGTYKVYVRDSTSCPRDSASVVVTAFSLPILANAGPDKTSCANNPNVVLSGSVQMATGGVWSGGLGGTFSPNNTTLNATYKPTPADTVAGSVTLTLTTTGNGTCPSANDQMKITIPRSPIVNAGPDQTVCGNKDSTTLAGTVTNAGSGRWTTSGTGVFFPNDSTLNAVYRPSSADTAAGFVNLTLTSIQNGACIPVADQMKITINKAPKVNAGVDTSLCANNINIKLKGGAVNYTTATWSGAGSFPSGTSSLTGTYIPTAAEIAAGTATITLRVTNPPLCNAIADQKIITITTPPTANAGPDVTVCGNNSAVTLNGSITVATAANWTTSGSGTFNNSTLLNATYTPSTADTLAGSVTLTLTTTTGNGKCTAAVDQMVITYTDAPKVNAGIDRSVCGNNASVVLNGSVAVATGGTWSGGTGSFSNVNALNATYTPSSADTAAGSVTLTLTSNGNGLCNAALDQMIITITDAPAVNAGPDKSVCGNSPAVNLNGTETVATGVTWTKSGTGTFNNANILNPVYTPSAADTAAGVVTLTITTTSNGNCNAVTDQMVVTITDAPAVNAGPDKTVCANNAAVSLNGSMTVATGGTWTKTGTGTFNNANILNPVYTPSAADKTLGTVTLTLTTTTGLGGCTAVADQMVINITAPPTVNAGPDQTVCNNNPTITLAGAVTVATGGTWSGGAGTFAPNANTLNATYTPSAFELTTPLVSLVLTSSGNGNCIPVTDTVRIAIFPAPVVSAGLDKTVCANNPNVTLVGTATNVPNTTVWSGGTGTWNPSSTVLNTIYTPSAAEILAGTATLTLTANKNLCTAVSDQMVITITPAPTINAGPDVTVCGNNAAVSLNGSMTVATGGIWTRSGTGTFNNPNISNAVYTPSNADTLAGSVTLTYTTNAGLGNCTAVFDQMVISITDAPVVNAGPDQTVCGNKAGVTLNGSVAVATGGTWSGWAGTINPNANTLNASYTPSAAEITAGFVNLTLTSTGYGNCNPVSDVMKINITPAPVVNAGPDQSICSNNSTATLAGTVTVAGGGIWTGGSGIFGGGNTNLTATYTPTATEISNGSVTLTLTSTSNGSCNQVSDQMTITYTPAPTITAGPDQTVCAATASVPLNGAVTVATGGNWTTSGTGTFSPNGVNGNYVPSAADKTSSVTLTITMTGFGNCTPLTDNMTITFTATPTVNAGPDNIVCTNDFPVQLAGSGNPSTWSGGGGTYTPSANALNATYQPSAAEITAQTVTLTLTTLPSGACTPIFDNVTISLPPGPIVNAGADKTICGDVTTVALNGSVLHAANGTWTTSGTGTFAPNTLTGNYLPSAADIAAGGVTLTLTSTGNGSCSAVTDQMVLTITPKPTISAGPDQTVCGDKTTVNLNGSATVATGVSWVVTSGTGSLTNATTLTPTYSPTTADTTAGSVTLTINSTGTGTCNPVSDQIVITFTDAPRVNAGPDQTICADLASTPLSATFVVATGGTWATSGTGAFTVNNSIPNPSYVPSAADTVTKTITLTFTTSGNGTCNAVSDALILTINPKPVVHAGPDQTVCGDIASVNLNGGVAHAGGGTWATSGTGTFPSGATVLNGTYKPSTPDTTGGVVTLTLTSSANGTCNAVSDQMVINFTPAPRVNAGPDQSICGDLRTATLNATVTVATGVTWTKSGTGSFSNPNILNPTYTASNADTLAGTVTLTATTTGMGTCAAVSDNLVLTILNVPIANAGSDQTVCGDVAGITLNGSVANATGGLWTGGGGTYSVNANTLNATYVPTAAQKLGSTFTLTLTTQGNGICNAVTDQMNITITPAPTVNAGPDQTVCADLGPVNLNGSVTVSTGGTWTSNGTGTFGNASNLITTYTPSATDISNGVVVLTLTSSGNGTCNPVTDQVVINITPAPTINAGPDRNICADMTSIVLSGSVTTATGATWTRSGTGTFTPNANTLNATYLISNADTAAHSVRFILTSTGNGTCNAVKDTMMLTITPAPVVNAGSDVTVCADINNIILAQAFVHNAGGGGWVSTGTGSFSPNFNTINPTYVLSAADKAAGNVTLTLTSNGNGSCNAVSDQMLITITPAPTVNAGPDQTVCATTAGVALTGVVTTATGGTWTTASNTGTFLPNANSLTPTFVPSALQITQGFAIIRLTSTGNGTCNPVFDDMRLTINPAPIVDAGPNQTVCSSAASVNITGTVTNATGGSWVTSGTGTFGNANALITTYVPSALDKIAGNVTLTLTSSGSAPCSNVSDNVTLGFSAVPTVDAGPATLCITAAGANLSGTVANAAGVTWTTSSGTGSFTASPNILTPHYTPSAADALVGSVKLYMTSTGNGPCAAAVDSIQVGIQPNPSANAGVDQIVCADAGTVSLNGSVANSTGGLWSSSGGGAFAASNTTLNATYTLSAVDITNGSATLTLTTTGNGFCNPGTDQMVITITPAPTINAGPDATYCGDVAGVPLSGSVTIATGGTWTKSGTGTFSPSANILNPTYIPTAADTAAGSVTVTITSTGNGTCIAVSDQKVITFSNAPKVNAGSDITICADVNAVAFTATTAVATGVTWTSTGTGTFDDPTLNTTQYTLSAADKTGGLVKLIATTTGNGTCNAVKDTVLLTITPAPTVVASAANACADVPTIQLSGAITVASGAIWTTSGTGTFTPDNLTLNAGYTPSGADRIAGIVTLTLTTTGSGTCNEVSTNVVLNIVPTPIANAGPDQTVCANVNVTLAGNVTNAGGGTWSTLGTGTFLSGALNGTYKPSAADTAAHSVKLVLTTTGNGSCNAVTDTMKISFTPAPSVNAGPAVICQNAGAVNLNAIASNVTGVTWTTAGNGVFGNPNALTTTYTPGPLDNPSVVITLTGTGNGTCLPVSDNIIINITNAPTANAGPDKIVCGDIALVSLNAVGVGVTNAGGGTWTTTNGTGTINNPSNLLTANYDPSTADTLAGSVTMVLTTTGNGSCLAVTDTMKITFTDAPVINAGPATVCANAPPVALNGSVTAVGTATLWTTSGNGTFGNATNLVTTYTPGPADLVSVTLTLKTTAQGTCNPVQDQITLFITPPPTANANVDQTICADSSSVKLNGSVSGATGGNWTTLGTGGFPSGSSILNGTYVPSNADTTAKTVKLVLTTTGVGSCNPVTDTMIISINPVPIVHAGADQTVCGDITSINLTGAVKNATGGVWSTTNGTPANINTPTNLITTYTPTTADTARGTVTFVLTSTGMGSCHPVRDTMVVTITDAPTINAGPQLICSDAVSISLHGTVTVATGVTWGTTGTGFYAPNNTSLITNYVPSAADRALGSVTLTLSSTGNGTCNAVSDQINLFLAPGPTANAGGDQGVCADSRVITLTGAVTNAGGGAWTTIGGGSAGFANANALNTTYTLTNADTTAHIATLILTTTGTAPCAAVTDTVVINITPAPVALVNAGNDTTICATNPTVNLTGKIANAAGGMWKTNGTGIFTPSAFTLNATYLPSGGDVTMGTIKLSLESTGNGLCNPVTDTMIVTIVSNPTANAGPNDTICANAVGVVLNGSRTVAIQSYWVTSGSGTFVPDSSVLNATYKPSLVDTADGTVILTLITKDNGCGVASDNMELTIQPAPTVDAGLPQTICGDGTSINLNGTVTSASAYTWSGGSNTFSNANILNPTYNITPADTTAGSITLTLTTNAIGFCGPNSDNVVITITDAPTLNAGPDQTICADNRSVVLNATATVSSGVQWTNFVGTGIYSPSNASLNTSYFTSDADTAFHSVSLVLTSFGSGTCKTKTDTVNVTITPAPIANAGPDQTVCANIGNVLMNGAVFNAPGGNWTTSGTGNFPVSNILNATYIPSQVDTANKIVILHLTTTGTVTCNPDTDNMRVTITPSPVVHAGPDQTICADVTSVSLHGAVLIATGGAWTTTGTGTFSDDSTLVTTYFPSAADTAAKTVKLVLHSTGSGLCNITTDTLILNITPKPIINAPANRNVCSDITSISLVGTVTSAATGGSWLSSGTGTFAPNPNTLVTTYTPTAADKTAGTIVLTLTSTGNGTCNAVSDNMSITFKAAPTINAGPDQIVCKDIITTQLNATKTGTTLGQIWTTSGSGVFTTATSLTPTYNPSSADSTAGVVILTVTTTGNSFGCNPASDDVKITLTPAPTINAGPDQGVCADAGVVNVTGIVTVATGGTWSTMGTGSFTPNPNALSRTYVPSAADTTAGTVSLVVTSTGNGTCNAVRDTMKVFIAPVPIVSTGGANICSDVTGVNLNGSVVNATGAFWSTSGSGTFTPNNTILTARYNPSAADITAGRVVLTLTSSGMGTCNAVSTTMNVTITPLPVANAGIDQRICRGSSTVLIAQSFPNLSYAWYTTGGVNIANSGITNVTANTDTSFVLTVTDIKSCSVNDTVAIFVVDPPALNLLPNYCFAFGTPMDANPLPIPAQGNFQWFRNDTLQFGENNTSIMINQIGTYVIEYNYGSCSVFDTTHVTPLPVLNGPDRFACLGSPDIVNTSNIVGGNYSWLENGNPFAGNNDSINVVASVIPYDSTEYIVTVTNTLGCVNKDTIYLVPVPPPATNISNVPSCIGDTVTLNASINSVISWHYSWYKNNVAMTDTTSTIKVTTTGSYMVKYTLGECVTTDTSGVTFFPKPVPSNLDQDKYCHETDITKTLDAGPGGTKYQWLNTLNFVADTLQTVVVNDPGMYYVTITNQFNCSAKDSILLRDICKPRVFPPGGFIPEGDNPDNAFFFIKGAYFKNFSITIFNRWGEVIFFSNDSNFSWDGRYIGELMPPGDYPYIITYEGEGEYKGPYKIEGSVVVIR